MRAWWLNQVVLEALGRELLDHAHGARVQLVRQADKAVVVVEVHSHGTTLPLVLDGTRPAFSVRSQPPRRADPTAPAFQGLLRKHLMNARLEAISAESARSSVRLTFKTLQAPMHLVLEWMRPHPNVVLVHGNGVVMGSADPAALHARKLRVGQPYVPIESHPVADVEIPTVEADKIASHPLAALPTHAAVEITFEERVGEAKDAPASPWRRRAKAELDRVNRLVKALEGDVDKSAAADAMRVAGERAKVMTGELERGVTSWTLRDPWDPEGAAVSISVDPALSVQQNVEKLFHKARRLDRTRSLALPRLEETRKKAELLRGLLTRLDAAESDVEDEVRSALGLPLLRRRLIGRAQPQC